MIAPYTNVDPEYPVLYREDINAHMWCVQYGGGGKYFDTIDEALAYMRGRFGGMWPSDRIVNEPKEGA